MEDKKVKETTAPSDTFKFYKKPLRVKKAPEVRQTKTSMQRILQANPLLKLTPDELTKIKKDKESRHMNTPAAISNSENSMDKRPKSSTSNNGLTVNKSSTLQFNRNVTSLLGRSRSSTVQPKSISKNNQPELTKNVTLRKSLSATHLEVKKGKASAPGPVRSSSQENMAYKKSEYTEDISTILEATTEDSFMFKSPSAYQRRSIFQKTPTTASSRRSVFRGSLTHPTLEELQHRLNQWLLKHGKNPTQFSKLKKVGGEDVAEEENKENIDCGPDLSRGSSYEALHIEITEDEPKLDKKEECGDIARSALDDLFQLIVEGYPALDCETWLELIVSKCPKLKDEPLYWECRARIEEMRGNVGDAVEHYKTAIIQGAEVKKVDKSLEMLLHKFSLLNINNSGTGENSKLKKQETKAVNDLSNVFRSTIIKFAVQQKKLKNQEIQTVVTPVRRSCRRSRSAYTSTPGMVLYNSLREMDSPEKSNINFIKNDVL